MTKYSTLRRCADRKCSVQCVNCTAAWGSVMPSLVSRGEWVFATAEFSDDVNTGFDVGNECTYSLN